MIENQNIEWKETWREEYFKWICGFANAQGGKIYIGRNDNGIITGTKDYKKLIENLPNQIQSHLGIVCDINLLEENNKYYIEIIVVPQSVPISFRGEYHFRSGSTKQELKGNALNEFLLKKSGTSWDNIIEPRAKFSDINENSIKKYLKDAEKTDRIPKYDSFDLKELLEKLRLTEGENLKRAAIILFGKDPLKFYPNISLKIGRFGKSDDDLRFNETIEGNLIELLDSSIEILNKKFLIRPVSFEGLHRIEKGEYPVAAIREMILNAIVHKNYTGSQIQLRVYDNKINIWNDGLLPDGITFESLRRQHPSKPRNPIIADVCYKGGYIDSWGRGTLKIIDSCKMAELTAPELKELDGGISVTIFKMRYTIEELRNLGLNDRQIKAIEFIQENIKMTSSDYQKLFLIKRTTAFNDLHFLIKLGLIKKSGINKSTFYYL